MIAAAAIGREGRPRTLEPVPTRVLIVDDHEVFRSRARALLELAGYVVVGEAADAVEALAKTRSLKPDVVLLDVQLPDRDGFWVAAELATQPVVPRVVFISSREASDYGSLLANAKVSGFIHKPHLSRARLAEVLGTTD